MDYVPWDGSPSRKVEDPRTWEILSQFQEPHFMAVPEFAVMLEQEAPEFSTSHTWAGQESDIEDDAFSKGIYFMTSLC